MESDTDLVIPEEDARAMVRMLAEVASSDGNHEEKKHLLMTRLCALVGGEFWVWGLLTDYNPDDAPVYAAMATGGFTEAQVPKFLLALDNRDLEDLMRPLGRELVQGGVQLTRRPVEYDPENLFGREDVAPLWKEADIGAPLTCYRPVSHNCLSGIGIYRRFGQPTFSPREAKITDIIMSEVEWLHEQGWPWESALRVPDLPKRCQMALNLLLEGLSRKQVADEMGISIHTLNDYIKHIYQFYAVHSQAELISRFRVGVK